MENSRDGFFCGGLFFCLILEAADQQRSKGDAMQNGSDGITEPNIMHGLINVVRPGHKIENFGSLKKDTSQYKTCIYSGGKNIPFNHTVTLQLFDAEVRESCQTVLSRMMDFVDSFLDPEKKEWLAKALLDVLSRDKGIQEDDILFVSANGQGTMKKAIFNLPEIEFQPFLLGIFHYLLMNRKDNEIGQQAFKQWYIKDAKGLWQYTGSLGTALKNIPPVKWVDDAEIPEGEAERPDGQPNETSTPDQGEPQTDEKQETASIGTQIINNPTIVNQNGVNNLYINQVGTLNL